MNTIKIVALSDIHYSITPHHGVVQEKSIDYILDLLILEKPNMFLSAGDFGTDMNEEQWCKLTNFCINHKILFYYCYGNHENKKYIFNNFNFDGTNCLIPDFDFIEANGLILSAISGNIGKRLSVWYHKDETVITIGLNNLLNRLSQNQTKIHILLTHEMPKLNLLTNEKHGQEIIAYAIKLLQPSLNINGHVSIPSEYKLYANTNTMILHLSDFGTTHDYAVVHICPKPFTLHSIDFKSF